MPRTVTRRQALQRSALAGATFVLGAKIVRAGEASPSEKLDLAFVGIGGRGRANLDALAREATNVVALADVDDERAGDAYRVHPAAKRYRDFRRLFDDLGAKIDGVVVSTPDHTHFHPAMAAIELGKHLFLEKPMAHSVAEARRLARRAAEKKVATQLGVQRHALPNVHRVVELIRARAIGDVEECHAWIGGERGMPAIPAEFPPVPPHLDWDLWLGPAAERPYSPAYVPYNWRFWWDFGTGETGNWGCHILDIPFWALELGAPARVESSGPPPHPQTSPKWMEVRYEFPPRGDLPPVRLRWYHTKDGPPVLREQGLPRFDSGVLFVGRKGMLLADFERRKLYPEDRFRDFEPPPKSIPDSPGFYREWLEAAKGRGAATCDFAYSGPLAEAVLLGNAAYRAGEAFSWDADALEPRGAPGARRFLETPYRKGWEL